jgi:endonuclease G
LTITKHLIESYRAVQRFIRNGFLCDGRERLISVPHPLAIVLIALLALIWGEERAKAEVLELQYEGFTVWLDCDRRGAIEFHYVARKDTGSFPRQAKFTKDPDVPDRCQQTSTRSYQSTITVPDLKYDLGHQVPANHFDGSSKAIAQTNFMTNILPQRASMNRGAWKRTEDIIECLRDTVDLEVWGGPVWGNNTADDIFVTTHGVVTPDAFWKIVKRSDNGENIAWLINNGEAPANALDQFISTVSEIERLTGFSFSVMDKTAKAPQSWPIPRSCNHG